MTQTVYIDILLAVNIFINYFLLLATAKFLSIRRIRLRILVGAVLGAVYALVMFLPTLPVLLSFLMKLLMSASLIVASFPWEGTKRFFKALACFYLMNFAFAGFMAALWHFAAPQGVIVKNAVVYFNISPLLLIGATAVCYVVIRLIYRFIGKQEVSGCCVVTVSFHGKSITCDAKIDTGNTLVEPFSHSPVLVIELTVLLPLFTEEEQVFFAQEEWSYSSTFTEQKAFPRIRMVPFQTVSGIGVLPAFAPEHVTIIAGKKRWEVCEVYVAVCKEKITGDGFEALLNPQVFMQSKEIATGRNSR